ncbi:unnamed protein product [Ceratitis capitata]|uniref:(Mediterranean fruit fly) hypothetical protein n=1 Tax=Ceratitis capitata TaxID=7213 RepID=A0A811U0S4_CERCA|nr:unnamed protein product [Ceratitis capitata]
MCCRSGRCSIHPAPCSVTPANRLNQKLSLGRTLVALPLKRQIPNRAITDGGVNSLAMVQFSLAIDHKGETEAIAFAELEVLLAQQSTLQASTASADS